MNDSSTNLIDDLRLLEAPRPLPLIWWIIMALALLGGIAFLLWRRSVARRPQPTPAATEAAIEDALAELEKLRALISAGNSRLYAIQVSGVVRRYIERRFGLVAPRRSTEEFLAEAKDSPLLGGQHQQYLREFL